LYRAAAELELRQMISIQSHNNDNSDEAKSDNLHRNRLQWLLVHIGCGRKFSPYTKDKNEVILTLLEGADKSFLEWILEDIENISCGKIFEMAPFVRHSIADVVFFHAWLKKMSFGTSEAIDCVKSVRDKIENSSNYGGKTDRFNQLVLTKSFLVESLDKICLDLLWFDSCFSVVHKHALRKFYHYCITRHSRSTYFQKKLPLIQDNTSIVSPIWQEILASIQNRDKTNLALIEQSCSINVEKFFQLIFTEDNFSGKKDEVSATAYGFLYKLSNLLERCVTQPFLKNSPLIWRLLLWCTSVENNSKSEEIACDNIKVMLYRALQDVPWCKALYLDTALYLQQRGKLTQTTRVTNPQSDSSEDEENENKEEIVPGTLDHIIELMTEKEIRVRLPLQELEVLMEPVE